MRKNTPARMKRFLWEFILWKDSIVLCFRSEKCRVTKIAAASICRLRFIADGADEDRGVLWVISDSDRHCRGRSMRRCYRGIRFWRGGVGFNIGRVGFRVVFAENIRLGLVQLQDREKLRDTQQECAEEKCAEPRDHGILKMEFVCFKPV